MAIPSCWSPWLSLVALGHAVAFGCFGCSESRPEWMEPPPIDPPKVLRAIMTQADRDENGSLEADELSIIPALQTSLTALDTDTDGSLSRDEIRAWLERVKSDAYAQQQAPFTIRYQGKPLANAFVKIVPEECMGGTIEPAEGTTNDQGMVFLNIQTRRVPGARCGLYRLEVSGRTSKGKPIPSKYSQNSPIGVALGGGLPQVITPEIDLE